jgi:hypothetical protein
MYYCLKCGKGLEKDDYEYCQQCKHDEDCLDPNDKDILWSADEQEPRIISKPWLGLIPFGLSIICVIISYFGISAFEWAAIFFGLLAFIAFAITIPPKKKLKRWLALSFTLLWSAILALGTVSYMGAILVVALLGFVVVYLLNARSYLFR